MAAFTYQNGQLMAEQVPLHTVAERYGTPCFVYSRSAIENQWHSYDQAFGERDHLICYAVKANSNLAIINLLARLGSGFDIGIEKTPPMTLGAAHYDHAGIVSDVLEKLRNTSFKLEF